jgi:hypothetical protein
VLRSLGPKVRKIMFGHREIVWAGRSLGEHAHLVDEVGDELAPADLEYLDGLPGGLQGGAVSHRVARRTVAVDQDAAFRSATNV